MNDVLAIEHLIILILAGLNLLVAILHQFFKHQRSSTAAQLATQIWAPLLATAGSFMIVLADAVAPKLYEQLPWLPILQVGYNAAFAILQLIALLQSARTLRPVTA